MRIFRTAGTVLCFLAGCGADSETSAPMDAERNSCMPTAGVARTRFFRSSGNCPQQTDAVFSMDPRSKASSTPGFSNPVVTATYHDGCEAFLEATVTLSAGEASCEVKLTQTVDWTLSTGKLVENQSGEQVLGTGVFAMAAACKDGSGCSGTFDMEVVLAN
jgi:hypothetical protein